MSTGNHIADGELKREPVESCYWCDDTGKLIINSKDLVEVLDWLDGEDETLLYTVIGDWYKTAKLVVDDGKYSYNGYVGEIVCPFC